MEINGSEKKWVRKEKLLLRELGDVQKDTKTESNHWRIKKRKRKYYSGVQIKLPLIIY